MRNLLTDHFIRPYVKKTNKNLDEQQKFVDTFGMFTVLVIWSKTPINEYWWRYSVLFVNRSYVSRLASTLQAYLNPENFIIDANKIVI